MAPSPYDHSSWWDVKTQTGLSALLSAYKCTLVVYIDNNMDPDQTAPAPIKLFSCSTQLSRKFQPLIKTKIPTNEEVFCLKSLRCCIYNANKC